MIRLDSCIAIENGNYEKEESEIIHLIMFIIEPLD